MKKAIVAVGLAGLLLAGAAFAETVYVRSRSAQIRAGQTALDRVVERVARKTPLEVLGKDGRWLLVRTPKGSEGWVYATRTAREEPKGDDSILARLGKGFRGEASETAATAGARGLDQVAEAHAERVGVNASEIAALNRMERFSAQIPEREVETFLRQGRVGEYQ